MRFHAIAASIALALGAASSMAAVCTSTTKWGSLGPPGFELFGNSFKSAGSYSDCYTFTLDSAASASGLLVELDLSNKLNIDTSVSLWLNGVQQGATDTSSGLFSFSNLAGGGLYSLVVDSLVTGDASRWTMPVAYAGAIRTIASAVPEPGAIALLLAGLAGVGAATWRRNKA